MYSVLRIPLGKKPSGICGFARRVNKFTDAGVVCFKRLPKDTKSGSDKMRGRLWAAALALPMAKG